MPLLARVIFPCPQFDNRPWPCVARHVDIAEPQMMGAPVHAFDDGIGRARQLVMQAAFNQAAQHGISDLVVMDGEGRDIGCVDARSEEHTSELQSLMRISYAVFCLKKKQTRHKDTNR